MAAAPTISDPDLTHLLSRLSSKQRVQSLLILSRIDGSIIRSSGLIARDTKVAAEYAGAVFRYMQATDALISETSVTDGQDEEVKMATVRTQKREVLVVPDEKFLLVVFHETGGAV